VSLLIAYVLVFSPEKFIWHNWYFW